MKLVKDWEEIPMDIDETLDFDPDPLLYFEYNGRQFYWWGFYPDVRETEDYGKAEDNGIYLKAKNENLLFEVDANELYYRVYEV